MSVVMTTDISLVKTVLILFDNLFIDEGGRRDLFIETVNWLH